MKFGHVGSLVVALALVAAGGALAADGTATATYENHGAWAELGLSAAPGSQFEVYGEQPDGMYMPVASGVVDGQGFAGLVVPDNGPINGQPQFYIQVMFGDGGSQILAITEPEFEWAWD